MLSIFNLRRSAESITVSYSIQIELQSHFFIEMKTHIAVVIVVKNGVTLIWVQNNGGGDVNWTRSL